MSWGEVELEPEVQDRYLSLDEEITRAGRLWKASRVRATSWIAPGRRIILLTVFPKTQRRERSEIERAKRAMEQCMREAHTVDDEG